MHTLKNPVIILLSIIILIGLFFRITNLSTNPSGFFCDEASIGYNAYTIAHNGTDEYGVSFPIFFQAFGEYKSPVQIYSTVPFVLLFGMNEFSTRLPSVLYGMIGIFAIFLLTRQLLKKTPYHNLAGLAAAFFLAVSPWHIHLSRIAFEQMPYVLFAILGLYFFLKYIEHSKLIYLLFSALSFTLSTYSYFPGRIVIPLLGIGLLIIFFQEIFKNVKHITIVGITVLIVLIPMIMHHFSPEGSSRWDQVTIFTHPPEQSTIQEHIIKNYLSHFSTDFLFVKGDIDMPGQFISRHSVRGVGELYLFQLPFLIMGSIYLIFKHRRVSLILILWLLLYPIGSMFTLDASAQATRSAIGIIPFQIISATGITVALIYFFKRIPIITLGLGFLLSLWILHSVQDFTYKYFHEYPQYSADFWGWQYGAREIITYFVANEHNYDELFMEGAFNAPHIFFNFYAPNECRNCTLGLPHERYNPEKKQLFAVTPYYLKDHPEIMFKTIKTLLYPDKKVAFQIGEIVQ